MKRPMKILSYAGLGLLGLILLLVVAVFALPSVIDWNRFKPRIAAAALSATGRELRIDGDLKLSLLPRLRVSAGAVRLANAAGIMTAPDMVSLESLSLEAELWPLFARRLVIDSLILKRPSIDLEVDKAGRPNWIFAPPRPPGAEPAATEAGGKSGAMLDVVLGDVRIEEGQLAYRDAVSGQTVAAKSIDLAAAMADLAKPLSITARMTLNGEPVSADMTVDSLSRLAQAEPAKVKLAVDSKRLAVHFDGAARQRPAPGLDGTFDLDIASVGQLMAWLDRPLEKSRPDPGPLRVHAEFASDGARTILKDATIAGTALDAKAAGSLDATGPVRKLALSVESGVLDVDRYLPPQSPQKTPAPAPAPAPPPARAANPLAALSDQPFDLGALRQTDLDVKVAIAGVKALGYELGRVAFAATAKGGVANAELGELALYGGTVKGHVKLDASGDALGLDTALRIDRVTVNKLAEAATGKATASGVVSATLDATARGASPRRLAQDLAGKLALDLGAVSVKAAQGHAISGLKLEVDLNGAEKPLSLKASLVYNGEPLSADATAGPLAKALSGERFPAKLSVASKIVALAYDGTVQQQPVPGLDGTFDLDVPSVGKLASWLDQPLDAKQPDPGPLKIHAVLAADGAKLALKDATITGKALKATAEGKFDGSQKVGAFDAKLEVQEADLNAYLPPPAQKTAAAAPAKPAAPAAGWSTEPFETAALKEANGQAQLRLAATRYRDLEVSQGRIAVALANGVLKISAEKIALGQGTIDGAATLDASGATPKLDYQASASGVEARPLLKTFAGSDRLSGTIQFQADGKAAGRNQKEMVEALNGAGQFKILDGAIHGVNLAAMLRQAGSVGLKGSEAEKTDFAELGGTWTIKDGVLENRDLKMLAPLVRLAGSGTVPMPPQTVDYTVEAKLVATIEGQGGKDALSGLPIPIKITGSWSDPRYNVDWNSVFTEMAKDPERLKNLPANLGNAAKSLGVVLPSAGAGGTGGLGDIMKGIPGVSGESAAPASPAAGAQPPPPAAPQQQQPSRPALPPLPKGLFGQ